MITRVVEMIEYNASSRETNSNDTEVATKKSSKITGINSQIGVMLKVML
jgi:hypothetical protein